MRKWLIHIALIFATVTTAAGQAIAPDGKTNWVNSHLIVSNGDMAYAVTYDSDNVYDLKQWDFGGWMDRGIIVPLPKHGLNPDGEFKVVDVIYFNQKVYITGKYFIDLSGSALNYVVAWDGSTWSTYTDTLITQSADIHKFVISNDNLMLLGMFGGSPITGNLLVLGTDNKWTSFGNLLTHDEANDFINDAMVHNGYIYVSGGFENAKGEKRILATLRNETWVYEGLVPFQTMTDNFGLYNGNMVLFGGPTFSSYDYFKELVGSSWSNISTGLEEIEVIQLNKMIQAGEYLWATGNFKDLSTSEHFSIMYFNGSTWTKSEIGSVSDDIVPLALSDIPYVYGKFTYLDAKNFGRIYPDQALLTGRVYEDLDGDCQWSAGDKPVPDAMIELTPGGYLFGLNSDGTYIIPVQKGNYTVKVVHPSYWKSICSVSEAVQVLQHITYDGLDFGIVQIPGKVDLYGHLTDFNGWVLQGGSENKIRLCVYNKGTADAKNVEVILYLDEAISNPKFSTNPDFLDGTKAVWNIGNIPAGSMHCFELTAEVPGSISNDLEFSYEINAGNDENKSDNTGTTSFEITDESFEPIRKSMANGELIRTDETHLLYKIRIHNIGNSTIDRVVIRDTFDEDIYIKELRFNYSFESEPELKSEWIDVGKNYQYVYTWTFNDAALVDSMTDPLASIGYLDVKIKLYPGMHPKGTQVCNTAVVRADNSEPVRTNTVCGAFGSIGIETHGSDLLQIRPNPADKFIGLNNPVGEMVNVVIYSSDGRVMMEFTMKPFETSEISIDDLSNGVYFIKMDGVGAARFIKSNY